MIPADHVPPPGIPDTLAGYCGLEHRAEGSGSGWSSGCGGQRVVGLVRSSESSRNQQEPADGAGGSTFTPSALKQDREQSRNGLKRLDQR